MVQVRRWAPTVWSLLLGLLLLGPALGRGYVLSYDMVWVPDLAVRPDAWGVGSALPRAVPSDLVVAVLDEVIPGMLLQKLVLLGALVAAGAGAAALVPRLGMAARLVAASVAVWNPFVVERLVIGHWPVLLGYAALPWLIVAGVRSRSTGRLPAYVGVLVLAGSLSAAAGLATALVLVVTAGRGRWLTHALLAVAANAPWVVSGLLHAGAARSDASAASVFATSGEGLLPAPLAALTLGGIWNADVVPVSRTGWLAVVWLVLLVALVVIGARPWWRCAAVAERRVLVTCHAVGLGVALVSWALPDLVGALAAELPGAGLLRDGSRLLGLCVPLLVVVVAHGARALATRMPDPMTAAVVGGALVIAPITVMPDAAWGAAGRLDAVELPASHHELATAVGRAPAGDVVVLPFTSFRAPGWNDGRTVLDPLPRLVGRDAVANDELSVSGELLAGEDPRAGEVRAALALPSASERSAALAATGLGVAVVDTAVAGQTPPEIEGEIVSTLGDLRVVAIAGDADERPVPRAWAVAMAAAWVCWLLVGLLPGVVARSRRRGDDRPAQADHR